MSFINSCWLYMDSCTDPYFNLAAEEYLLTNSEKPIIRLWRNSSSVIVGRNQNTLAEINKDYIETHNIPVVRRLSGGGAVFHDIGNVNFSFISDANFTEAASLFKSLTEPIRKALCELNLQVELTGRNDLTIDGKKISGNAIYVNKGKELLHGTLLFSASKTDICNALNSSHEKYAGRAVASHSDRVTNIIEHLSPSLTMSVEKFIIYLSEKIREYFPYCELRKFTDSDVEAINRLKQSKYATYEWNYGKSPSYTYSNKVKFPAGVIELYLCVEKGIITNCRIMGDYFFINPINELENSLIGVPHNQKQIEHIVQSLPIDKYLCGIDSRSLLTLF